MNQIMPYANDKSQLSLCSSQSVENLRLLYALHFDTAKWKREQQNPVCADAQAVLEFYRLSFWHREALTVFMRM